MTRVGASMSKLDRLKEDIGLLKLFLAALIVIDVSLIALGGTEL